ncbi:MAG: ABC transporter permease [Pseudomonadales bacterium]|nr:ABC transporter permease [Pseudomonadales bacterium]
MTALDKKLWRELWQMRTQALAIALVIVGGVAIFIMSLSTLDSLYTTRQVYYTTHHFADVFSTLKRAPLSVLTRIEAITGVDKVEGRVIAYVNIDVAGFADPISGHLLSLPATGVSKLNQLYLRTGSLPDPGRNDQVLVSDEFAAAHQLRPGDQIKAIINGRSTSLRITGLVLSPEYIYQIAPGAMFPDYERYGIFWMAQPALASAYDMEGAFNDVSLTLNAAASLPEVLDQLDALLKPYGGTGAYSRTDQLSNRFLTEELKQQETVATVFPLIFLGVAAFLLNVVISRLVSLEREQIAVLKAFGYSNGAVARHYMQLTLLIVLLGIIGGIAAGAWMGRGLSMIYMDFYSLPFLIYVLRPTVILAAAGLTVLVTVVGTLHAVRRAARLPPAQAMRPEPPATFRITLVERLGLQRWLNSPTRMILRQIERQRLKSGLTTLGIAMACGVMMIGGFQQGAIDHMVWVQFQLSQRDDMLVMFTDSTSTRALGSLRGVPGVEAAEGFRTVPALLHFEHHSYRTPVQGIAPDSDLLHLLDARLQPVRLPPGGLVLTDYLAKLLNVRPGDLLEIEELQGKQRWLRVPVVATTSQYVGVAAYMRRPDLNRLLQEGEVISGAMLRVDARDQRAVYARLKAMPRIAAVVEQDSAVAAFYATLAETVLFFTSVSTLLGASIAFGVVYNSMRIALSERHRDLASLRVLGYEVGEVAYILLGELGLLVLLAIPLGLLIGHTLCAFIAHQFSTDLYRIPLVLAPDVYAFAALVVLVSALLSAMVIWRHLRQLDLVGVLKTRE